MLYRFKLPLLTQLKERSLSGVLVGLVLLAMTGWIYLLSTMFLKFALWFFS
ncbi:hypothetical protein [Bradyrhizobium sp. ORS 86]|uniref:hypothetical protein n=1 Tax=Bradyrhizobium sp. ORS 86 TaxID=1685970 RepID=UPI00388FB79E